jgi:hypothetical protein
MSWQDFPLETFLDLLADMPDTEAIDEIDTRLQRIKDDRREIGEAAGRNDEREALNLEEDQLRLRRAKLVVRMEQRKWSKAIRAVYGEEGFEKCLAWVRSCPDDDISAIAVRRTNEKKKC